jgi:hypothetical protein
MLAEMLALALLVLYVTQTSAQQAQVPSTLERVRVLADAGDFPGALALARAEPDAAAGAQAEVWLYFRARDFGASLAAAERALALVPGDPWLLERACASALRLRAPALASAWTERFAAAVAALPPAEASPWQAQLAERRRAVAVLVSSRERAAAALRRARVVAPCVLVLTVAALSLLALRRA